MPTYGVARNIEASKHDEGTAYLTVDAHEMGDFNPYVYMTTNHGRSWKKITSGIEDSPLSYSRMIKEDPVNPSVLYLGTENALYFSLDKGDNWQSLMRRNATYTFPKASGSLKTEGVSVQDEEGVLTMGATRPPESDDEADQQELFAHETIAQWEGWSLVAPPIGQYIGTEDELAPPNSKQSPPADFEYQVETDVSIVPKSLPRLRYGRT